MSPIGSIFQIRLPGNGARRSRDELVPECFTKFQKKETTPSNRGIKQSEARHSKMQKRAQISVEHGPEPK
jgi:hypothetical protein